MIGMTHSSDPQIMRPERDKKLYDISCPAGFASHIGCYKTS